MESAGLLIADAIVLAVVGILAVHGWRRGFIGSLIGIAGLIAAVWAGARFAVPIAERLVPNMTVHTSYALAFLTVFVGVAVAVSVVGKLASVLLRAVVLSPINSLAGAALGAVKGVIVVALVTALLALLPITHGAYATLSRARTVQLSVKITGTAVRAVEPYVSEPMSRFMDRVDDLMERLPPDVLPAPKSGTIRT
jgi:uncharacterized membrane protein required for colicin V production